MELEQEIQDRVILGLPVQTSYGLLKPLSIEEFMKRQQSVAIISLDKKKLLSELGLGQQEQTGQKDSEIHKMLMELNKIPLKQLMNELFKDLYHHYAIITRYCVFFDEQFDEELHEDEEEFEQNTLIKSIQFLEKLTDEEFDEFRLMLLALHSQTEVTAHLNPYLEKRNLRAKKGSAKRGNDAPTLSTMVSSCATYTGIDYKDISKWNILQLTHTFQRISYFVSHSNSVLYSTVASDVDVINWSENIVADKELNKDKSLAEFQRTMGETLN